MSSYTAVMRIVGVSCAVVMGLACSRPPTSVEPNPEPLAPSSPAEESEPAETPNDTGALEAIETEPRSREFTLRFDIEADGIVSARLVGELRAQGEGLLLRARGTFDGEPVELALEADGRRLRGSGGSAKLDLPQPDALTESIVIGLTRMGLMHNLAVLLGGRPPDHADGGVQQWVRAEGVEDGARIGPPEPIARAQRETASPISFAIIVADTHVGDATLWRDSGTRLPVERHQVVRFPEGELRVRETYEVE